MGIEIRPAVPEDLSEIGRLDGIAFGEQLSAQDLADAFDVEPPRFVVATEDGSIVGVAGDFRFDMTVPGSPTAAHPAPALPSLGVPGVTWVSVSPTRRRRGILRRLMEFQLAEYAAAAEPAAILTASQGGIYRRFGYGPAAVTRAVSIDRRLTGLLTPVADSAVQVLSADRARAVLPSLHRNWRKQVPGALSRSEAWWDRLFLDREQHRGGRSAKFYLVHPEGYLTYRIHNGWNGGDAESVCSIVDYAPGSASAHAALWQTLLAMDLVSVIESEQVPIDDPLPFLLTDHRALKTTALRDGLWLRPVTVPALLAARGYGLDVDVVIRVLDDQLGDSTVRLQATPGGAMCEPASSVADIELPAAALGSVYLGGHRLRTLARAGLARADDPALLARVDLAFAADPAPRHGTGF